MYELLINNASSAFFLEKADADFCAEYLRKTNENVTVVPVQGRLNGNKVQILVQMDGPLCKTPTSYFIQRFAGSMPCWLRELLINVENR